MARKLAKILKVYIYAALFLIYLSIFLHFLFLQDTLVLEIPIIILLGAPFVELVALCWLTLKEKKFGLFFLSLWMTVLFLFSALRLIV